MVLSISFLVECIVDLKWLKRFCYDYNDDVNSNSGPEMWLEKFNFLKEMKTISLYDKENKESDQPHPNWMS